MKNIGKNLAILFFVLIISYLFSPYFGEIYNRIFNQSGTYVDLRGLSGLSLAYIFFLILLFYIFGERNKYYWIFILLIPVIIIEFYLDLEHIYFPILLGLLGWFLGWGILKLRGSGKGDMGQNVSKR